MVVNQTVGRGFIRVHAYPWAKVSVDGKPAGETPIDKPIELVDGTHTLTFEHPWYVAVERPIEVNGTTRRRCARGHRRLPEGEDREVDPASSCRRGDRVIRALHVVALAIAIVVAVPPRAARAQAPTSDVTIYRVKQGDTLDLIAAEFYGDRNKAIFIMVANKIQHPRALRPGERLRIPVTREVTTSPGDTFEIARGELPRRSAPRGVPRRVQRDVSPTIPRERHAARRSRSRSRTPPTPPRRSRTSRSRTSATPRTRR